MHINTTVIFNLRLHV